MPTPGKKSARKTPVSASRQVREPKAAKSRAPKASRSAASAEWMRGMRLNTYTITLLAMIVLGVLTLAPRVQEWFVLRQQVAQAQADVEQARKDVTTMQSEVKRWEDPVYIRSQARDRLYYVMPGEVSYLVMDADGVNTLTYLARLVRCLPTSATMGRFQNQSKRLATTGSTQSWKP